MAAFTSARSRHSQTIRTRRPTSRSARTALSSRNCVASSLLFQNAARVFGNIEFAHPCECQKQPCTKIAVRCFGKTISGFPGKSFLCNRNRKPFRCNQLRTNISGFVFLPLIAAIFRDRAAVTGGSAFGAGRNKFVLETRHWLVALRRENTRHHDAREFLNDRNDDGIPELTVRLRVGH